MSRRGAACCALIARPADRSRPWDQMVPAPRMWLLVYHR